MGRHLFRSSLFLFLVAIAALAFGQSFSSDGSGTLTVAGRRNQIARIRTEPGGNRIRIIVWTTNDKRFDLVGDSAKQGDSYRIRLDDGLGERNLTGFANIYTSDWTTLKSITASGRFSGGIFDLSFQADRGGSGWKPNPGNGGGRMGELNIAGVRYRIDKADYRMNGDNIRLVLTADNGKEFHLVGNRDRRNNMDDLDFNDGLGEERLNGRGRVNYSRGEVTSASGSGSFRGGSFAFNVTWNGNSGGGFRPQPPVENPVPPVVGGKLRFDNNSYLVTRVEYNREGGNKFRLVMWTDRGQRYDILGTRSESGNRDKLYINDGLGKSRMDGTGTIQYKDNTRNKVTSITLSGRYSGGSYTVSLSPR